MPPKPKPPECDYCLSPTTSECADCGCPCCEECMERNHYCPHCYEKLDCYEKFFGESANDEDENEDENL